MTDRIKEQLSAFLDGELPETDVIAATAVVETGPISAVRLEVLADDGLPRRGPGRVPNTGSFVLSEIKVTAAPAFHARMASGGSSKRRKWTAEVLSSVERSRSSLAMA